MAKRKSKKVTKEPVVSIHLVIDSWPYPITDETILREFPYQDVFGRERFAYRADFGTWDDAMRWLRERVPVALIQFDLDHSGALWPDWVTARVIAKMNDDSLV